MGSSTPGAYEMIFDATMSVSCLHASNLLALDELEGSVFLGVPGQTKNLIVSQADARHVVQAFLRCQL